MNTSRKNNKKSNNPFYNICIVDKSHIYALGLKNSIDKSLNRTAHSFVFHHLNIYEINPLQTSLIDILFVDYDDLLLPDFNNIFLKLKRKNPEMKLIISTSDLLNIDFIKLYTYNINGLFSKSLSIKSFNIYFKRVLDQSIYIDHYCIRRIVEEEKKQKIKYYYKSVSLQNLELIQNRYLNYTPYFVDKGTLSFLHQ
jgi:DNA-binding NarL/FixJ family response regulator